MGKVITSQGLNEFVTSGKHETVENHKPEVKKEAPPLEVKQEIKPADVKEKPVVQEDDGLEADDIDLTEHVRKKIGKKHRAMREAQEKAEEAERFAENQYNERLLAQKRADELETKIKDFESTKVVKQPELKEPDENDPQFKEGNEFNWRKFTKAQADFAAAKAVADDRAKQETQRQADAAAEVGRIAAERLAESVKKFPDLREKMDAATWKTHNSVLAYINTSPLIGEISNYLLDNPAFVERINKLDPWSARDAVVELATTLKKPAEKPVEATPVVVIQGAPAPITPLNSSTAVNTNTDPSKMGYKELRAYYDAKKGRIRR